MKKVALMLGDGFEPIEALAPTDVLRRGGVRVDLISVMKRLEVTTAQNIEVKADLLVEDITFDDYDLILVPGGSKGVENLGKCAKLADALPRFMQAKSVASICAGPMILANLHLLEGRSATCYPGCETDFPQGVYQHGFGVVVDGNLVTASGPGQAIDFGVAILRVLEGDATADQVAHDMLITQW